MMMQEQDSRETPFPYMEKRGRREEKSPVDVAAEEAAEAESGGGRDEINRSRTHWNGEKLG